VKYKNLGPDIWKKIDFALEKAKDTMPKLIAAFDADGTLWDTDLGENFFQFQIKNKLLSNLPKEPWKYYRTWKESGDPRPAYLWLAQINQGHSLSEVRSWAEDSVRGLNPFPLFDAQKKLIEKLLKANADVYIVTASVKWSVEPGALRLGIPVENVLGVATKIMNGKITDEQDGEITYREGKSQALLKTTDGKKPFLCSGNTMGDLSLLECATELQLAVGAAPESHELFSTEERLRQEAKARGWCIHRF